MRISAVTCLIRLLIAFEITSKFNTTFCVLDKCDLMRILRSVFSLGLRKFSQKIIAMEANGVIPDVIDAVPANSIQVKYDSGVEAKQGNELTPTQVRNRPKVHFDADSDSLFTFCLTDPDAPSRTEPKYGEWLHWLIVNVPGNDLSKGETINDYIGSGPPKGTGLHRYIFLVYKQPGKLTCDEQHHTSQSGKGRSNFKIRSFAKKYGLGSPLAGNFYQAQWDDYVPKLYEQIKD